MKSLFMSLDRGVRLKLLGLAVVIIASLVVYQPSIAMEFWTDDYWYLETAGRLSMPDYLRAYFDPLLQWRWYRPMQGLEWRVAYALFQTEPLGYHVVQTLLYVASTVLLYLLVTRLTRKMFIGTLAALLYLTFPIDNLAVFWPAVADPLLSPFFLLAIWFWLDYLERGSRWRYAWAFAMVVAALLTKEIAATLPLVLFLADRWLVRQPATLRVLVRRYALFLIALALYAWLELHAVTQGLFTTQLDYGPGVHILEALVLHLANLVFPWSAPTDAGWVALLIVLLVSIILIRQRKLGLIFLLCATLLTLLPILPFQLNMASAGRYLYLPLLGSAVAYALLAERGLDVAKAIRWNAIPYLTLAGFIPLLAWSGAVIARNAESFGNVTRAERVQFRSIFQKHPSFAPGTFLYFLYPPDLYASNIMFARYGAAIQAESTVVALRADLSSRTSPLVLYLDDDNTWQEQQASRNTRARSFPDLPVQFGGSIHLEGFEMVNDQVQRGDAVIVILYWRTDQKIDRDYTVFAHVVDREGRTIAGTDKQPDNGTSPTSGWRPGNMIVDAAVVPIPRDTPTGGDYQLEIGLYDLSTLQRLAIAGANDQSVTDKIVIEPIQIIQ